MYYSISQVAKKYGITAHTLRDYDKEGLLPFVERSVTGVRKFSETDLRWLEIITCLKETGLPIKQIKQFINWCQEGDAALEQRYNVFVEQKKNVETQMAILQKHLEKIEYKIWYYKTALEAGTEAVHRPKQKIRFCEKTMTI